MAYKKSVCALIINRDNPSLYLGISRKYDVEDIGLVGGKNNESEPDLVALAREVEEETGLTIYNPLLVFSTLVPGGKVKKPAIDYWCNCYTCDYIGEPATQDGEGVVKWVPKEVLIAGCFGEYNAQLFNELDNRLK